MTKKSRFTLSKIVEKIKQLLTGGSKKQAIDEAVPLTDDLSLGDWKKHIFIAPGFGEEQLVAKLDYYIYTPASTPERPSTKGMPLIVMLHGCTQNTKAFAEGTKMNYIAQQEGFVVLYPQQSISYNLGKCWRWYDLGDSQGMAEAHTIMKIIQSVITMHELDSDKVFIAGMSAGAGMASVIAATYPKEIQALALHSSPALAVANDMKSGVSILKNGFDDSDGKSISCVEDFAQKKSHDTPTIILHGMEDDVVHIDNLEALTKQFLYLNNLELSTKGTITKYLSGTEKEYSQTEYKDGQKTMVEVLKIKHLEHAWSGGDKRYPFHSNKGPQASRIIWDFFKNSLK